MKAIILAAGQGTRLHPTTKVVSKHLLPVYNYPMIYYPVQLLNRAGVSEILIITNRQDLSSYHTLFGDSYKNSFIYYAIQEEPRGVADAINIGRTFIGEDKFILALGDNLFYGQNFEISLWRALKTDGSTVFAFPTKNPELFGILDFDRDGQVIGIEEKPLQPKSSWAVAGLYVFDAKACDMIRSCKPSVRGELEIADILNIYLKNKSLHVELMHEDSRWFDLGTPDGLLDASNFVQKITSNGVRQFYG